MTIELTDVSICYERNTIDGFSLKQYLMDYLSNVAHEKKQAKKDNFYALDNISLRIDKGEKVGLIGLNGAGKSTLLRVLATVLRPTSGQVSIKGRVTPILDFSTGFEEHHSGRENAKIRLMFLGESDASIKEKTAEIIEFSELHDFIDQPCRTYSTGMFMRLAFATSTSITPEILIADEVIGAGDARFAAKAEVRFEKFMTRGQTLVISSHSMDLIQRYCERCIWLERGRIKMDGPTPKVVDSYLQYHTQKSEIGSFKSDQT